LEKYVRKRLKVKRAVVLDNAYLEHAKKEIVYESCD